MTIFYLIYRVLTLVLVSLAVIPFLIFSLFTGRYRKHIMERLGYVPGNIPLKLIGKPRIWIHGVSLGEIKVANSIICSLEEQIPGCSIILSTTTEHGRDLANELLGDRVPVIYSPVDLFFAVKKSLNKINPDILIFLETEIWPSWIIEARRAGVRIALLNGRISKRSIKSYVKVKSFFKGILANFDLLSMISMDDEKHIKLIGADPEKTAVNGNAKYDMLISQTTPGMNEIVRKKLQAGQKDPLIVAGSTRSGEEALLLDSFEKITGSFPDALLVIAPRHLDRVKDITGLLKDRKFEFHLWGEVVSDGFERTKNIIVIDCYGELFNVYSAADIAFCGASLVPLGGQNPLEPAAWGSPVFHGPHMDDFLDAESLLRKYDADIMVKDAGDFAEKAVYYLNNHALLKEKGAAGKNALMESRNASQKHAAAIAGLVKEKQVISR